VIGLEDSPWNFVGQPAVEEPDLVEMFRKGAKLIRD
jgi:hypothetical protein